MCHSCEDIVLKLCAMLRKWQFFGYFLRLVFSASCVQHISDMHSKFALRPHHMWLSMVDIQSLTAENKQGKEEDRNHSCKI